MNRKTIRWGILGALISHLGCLSAAAAGVVLLPPEPARELPRYLQEDETISLELPVEQYGGAWIVTQEPRHGSVLLSAGIAEYHPAVGYFGRDDFTLLEPESGRSKTIDLRVLPRYQALAGKFLDEARGAALFDSLNLDFLLCQALEDPGQPMSCNHYKVVGLENRHWVSLAWPTKDSRDLPALMDLETGELFILFPQRDGTCKVLESFDLEVEPGGWPILGDWDASGEPSLLMAFEDGRVLELQGTWWQEWPIRLKVPAGDFLLWPFLIPWQDGNDTVGVVDAQTGTLVWLGYTPKWGSEEGQLPSVRGGDFRRPMSWIEAPVWPEQLAAGVFFLEQSTAEGLNLVTGHYYLGAPHIIPIKFPDDPPGG